MSSPTQYTDLGLKLQGYVGWFIDTIGREEYRSGSLGGFPMTFQTAPFFPHRRNKDGSFDSICLKCFATIASHMTQDELKEFDQTHVCANSLLSQRGDRVSLTHDEIKPQSRR
jgi:hypothetical protein